MTFEEKKEGMKVLVSIARYNHKRINELRKAYDDLDKEFQAYKKKVEYYESRFGKESD